MRKSVCISILRQILILVLASNSPPHPRFYPHGDFSLFIFLTSSKATIAVSVSSSLSIFD